MQKQHFLKSEFKRQKITQEQIAQRLGYSQPRVSQILSGDPATPDVETQLVRLLMLKIKEVKQNGV